MLDFRVAPGPKPPTPAARPFASGLAVQAVVSPVKTPASATPGHPLWGGADQATARREPSDVLTKSHPSARASFMLP